MFCMWLAGNTGCKNDAKNCHLRTVAQLCRVISSQLRHVSTIGKKLVKQQYLLQMSSQYGKLPHTNGWDWFRSLGHPSKFQLVLHLGFDTAPTSLTGGHQTLHDLWPFPVLVHHIYIFGGCCPPDGILPGAKFTVRPSLAFSYIGTVTVWHSSSGASQTLRHGTRNGIAELLQRATPILGWAAIKLGIGPHSSGPYLVSKSAFETLQKMDVCVMSYSLFGQQMLQVTDLFVYWRLSLICAVAGYKLPAKCKSWFVLLCLNMKYSWNVVQQCKIFSI